MDVGSSGIPLVTTLSRVDIKDQMWPLVCGCTSRQGRAKPILQSHPISDLLVSTNWYYASGQSLVVFRRSEMRVSLAGMVPSEKGGLRGIILRMRQIQKKARAQRENAEAEGGGAVVADAAAGDTTQQVLRRHCWSACWCGAMPWSRQVWATCCSRKARREEPRVVGQLELTLGVLWSTPGSGVDHSLDPCSSIDIALADYQILAFPGMPPPFLTVRNCKCLCWICCTYFEVSFIVENISELFCIWSIWLSVSLAHSPSIYWHTHTHTCTHTHCCACSLGANLMGRCCGSKRIKTLCSLERNWKEKVDGIKIFRFALKTVIRCD